jgi:signal transduction histidine kinase
MTSRQISSHRVRIEIQNSGSHISPNVIQKILQPFFLDEDVMNHSVGMGLGLSVCQSILKAHGTTLTIDNTPNGVLVAFEIACL